MNILKIELQTAEEFNLNERFKNKDGFVKSEIGKITNAINTITNGGLDTPSYERREILSENNVIKIEKSDFLKNLPNQIKEIHTKISLIASNKEFEKAKEPERKAFIEKGIEILERFGTLIPGEKGIKNKIEKLREKHEIKISEIKTLFGILTISFPELNKIKSPNSIEDLEQFQNFISSKISQ